MTVDPTRASIGTAIDNGLGAGAIGVKILGGHFPFSPEATLRIIEESAGRGVYIAFHVGTTATGSNLRGIKEALGMAILRSRPYSISAVSVTASRSRFR